MKIIMLNGPAGSGKDTVGKALYDYFNSNLHVYAELEKFAAPLKARAKALFSWTDVEFNYYMETQSGKAAQIGVFDTPLTYRQLLIQDSEDNLKPLFGPNVFSKLMIQRLQPFAADLDYLIVTDCGFAPEVETLAKEYGEHNCLLVQLHRKGTSFEGDSRDYIKVDSRIKTLEVSNDGTVDEAVETILNALQSLKPF